jgi:HEXXH motif-containing protein
MPAEGRDLPLQIEDALRIGWSFEITRREFDAALDARLSDEQDKGLPSALKALRIFEKISSRDAAAFLAATAGPPTMVRLPSGEDDAVVAAVMKAIRSTHPDAVMAPGEALRGRLEAALSHIAAWDRDTHDQIRRHLFAVYFLDGIAPSSFTVARFFGHVFLSARESLDTEDIALLLIHEMAHTELNLITLFDDLFSPQSLRTEAYAPFQQKMRGPVGRVHAAHALYRMLNFARASHSQHTEGLLRDFAATLATFDDVEPTSLGKVLIAELYRHTLVDGIVQ